MENKIDLLLETPAYSHDSNSRKLYMEALQEELIFHYEHNPMYRRFCDRKQFNPYETISSTEQIPSVAVSVFKELGLKLNSVPKEDVAFTLQSSATSGIPSSILVDKLTSKRQSKAMVKVMEEFIGKRRLPFLVMDMDPRGSYKNLLGARFAAVTGYLKFASKVGYFLKAHKNNISYFDIEGIQEYVSKMDKETPVIVFGFTYILYSNVLKEIQRSSMKIQLPKGSKVIHIGGWKRLESEKIKKDQFNTQLAKCFSILPEDIIDIYGFTEQMGLNYPDCPCGCKHISTYVDVLVRDAVTHEVLPAGEEGLLEFISPLPHSYPGNAVLTDDLGVIIEGECPFNRQGKRFKILGRLKKAEVRGCGDVLSSKLIFQNKENKQNVFEISYLDIQYFKGQLLSDLDEEKKLLFIIDKLQAKQNWLRNQPVDALIGLIDKVSKKWLNDVAYQFLKDKGLFFLSSWCKAEHLEAISQMGLRGNRYYVDSFLNFPDSEKHFLKANPRGLICHWMAGNVQILGLFALVQCIITKNVNLLKVSAKDDGVFALLLKAFEGESYTLPSGYTIKGDDLLETIAVVHFNRDADNLAKLMSRSAHVRIGWGGKEAVEAVAGYPSMFDSDTVIFGPKLSFSVISRESLIDEQSVKKLARKLAVDIAVFDQTGCASPHNLYIENSGYISPLDFCKALNEALSKVEKQIPKPSMTSEQVAAIHSARGVYDFKGLVLGSASMTWTILYSEENELSNPVYSRVIMVHAVNDIEDSLEYVSDNIQTIGLSVPKERAISYAVKASKKGASRFPVIGKMLNFEMPWDGIILMDRLVKWNTLGGPLC